MSKTYLNGVRLVLTIILSIFSIGCRGNPSHSLPLKGNIDIGITSDGIICFKPNLNSVTFAGKPRSDIEGIRAIRIAIPMTTGWSAYHKDKFAVISNKMQTCITDKNFKDTPYKNLVHGMSYDLYLTGLTADGVYHVDLTGSFYYQ